MIVVIVTALLLLYICWTSQDKEYFSPADLWEYGRDYGRNYYGGYSPTKNYYGRYGDYGNYNGYPYYFGYSHE